MNEKIKHEAIIPVTMGATLLITIAFLSLAKSMKESDKNIAIGVAGAGFLLYGIYLNKNKALLS